MRKIIPYKPYLKAYARKLRNNSTLSEIVLWRELGSKKFYGYRFIRQKPLLDYIVDFYCYELELVIELDGYSHELIEIQDKDKNKEESLKEAGLHILRFTDEEVFKDMANVLLVIKDYIDNYE